MVLIKLIANNSPFSPRREEDYVHSFRSFLADLRILMVLRFLWRIPPAIQFLARLCFSLIILSCNFPVIAFMAPSVHFSTEGRGTQLCLRVLHQAALVFFRRSYRTTRHTDIEVYHKWLTTNQKRSECGCNYLIYREIFSLSFKKKECPLLVIIWTMLCSYCSRRTKYFIESDLCYLSAIACRKSIWSVDSDNL